MEFNTYCTFPKKFIEDNFGKEEIRDLYYYINRLWANSQIVVANHGMVYHVSKIDGIIYNLPVKLPNVFSNPTCTFVRYLQNLLDINGHSDMIVFLDNQGSNNFEILTKDELLAKLEYPIEEYRYDSIGIIHPNIKSSWGIVTDEIGKMFKAGCCEDFPHDSIAYRESYGECSSDCDSCSK